MIGWWSLVDFFFALAVTDFIPEVYVLLKKRKSTKTLLPASDVAVATF